MNQFGANAELSAPGMRSWGGYQLNFIDFMYILSIGGHEFSSAQKFSAIFHSQLNGTNLISEIELCDFHLI